MAVAENVYAMLHADEAPDHPAADETDPVEEEELTVDGSEVEHLDIPKEKPLDDYERRMQPDRSRSFPPLIVRGRKP